MNEQQLRSGTVTWFLGDDRVEFAPELRGPHGPLGAYQTTTASWLARLHPEDADAVRRAFTALAERTAPMLRLDVRVAHPDGPRRLELWGLPHYAESGALLRVEGAQAPVAAPGQGEGELRESERRLTTLLGNLPGLAYRCHNDRDWTMELVSEGCEDLLGVPAEALTRGDVRFGDLVHPDDAQDLWDGIQTALVRGERFAIAYRLRHADGSWRHVLEHGRGVPGGRIEGFISDQTARQRAEEALQEADQQKDRFLAVLAHELRNPVAALRLSAERLRRVAGDDPELAEVHRSLSRQVGHVARLVDGLIDVSRIVSGKVSLERRQVDLRRVVVDVLEDQGETVRQAGLTLVRDLGDAPMLVEGDPVRLAQVVDNLIGNAVKFTPPLGTVAVSLHRTPTTVEFVVEDDGVGIAPEAQATIFEPFRQALGGGDTGAGLGLGLALVRGLIALHGGEVELASLGEDEGTTVTVRLPLTA